jgi:hypothetical protein
MVFLTKAQISYWLRIYIMQLHLSEVLFNDNTPSANIACKSTNREYTDTMQ